MHLCILYSLTIKMFFLSIVQQLIKNKYLQNKILLLIHKVNITYSDH